MKTLNIAIFGLGLVIAVGVLLAQRREVTQMRRELAGLRTEIREMAERRGASAATPTPADFGVLAQGIQRSEEERAELEKLKEDVAAMKNRTQEIVRTAQARWAEKTAQEVLVPVSQWKNGGKATPQAGLETALWAAAGGELDTLADSIGFTASSRQKADAFFAGLSETTQRQYGSPEKLIALMIAKEAAAVSGMQVLGQKAITADDVGLRLRFSNDQGKTKENDFLMHRTADGWRLLLPDKAVEKYAQQIGGGK